MPRFQELVETPVCVGQETDSLDRFECQRQRRHRVHVVGQHQRPTGLRHQCSQLAGSFRFAVELDVVEVVADQRGEIAVGERRGRDLEVRRVGEAVAHHRLGEQVGEVEGDLVAARELEVEQLDRAVLELHHVAVVRVVVAEHGRPVGQAVQHLGGRVVAVDLGQLVAQRLLVDRKPRSMLAQHRSGDRPPFVVQELEERLIGQVVGGQLMEPEQLVGDPTLDLGIEHVVGGQGPADEELFDSAGVVVVVAVGGDVVRSEQQEHLALGLTVEDRVLLARQMAVQRGRWVGRDPRPDPECERRESLRFVEVEVLDRETSPARQRRLTTLEHLDVDLLVHRNSLPEPQRKVVRRLSVTIEADPWK